MIRRASHPLGITKNRAKELLKYKIIALVVLFCLYPPQSQSFDNENPTVFITGSNRNIGLEFVKQFSENNWNVIATARNPEAAKELQIIAAEQDKKNPLNKAKVKSLEEEMKKLKKILLENLQNEYETPKQAASIISMMKTYSWLCNELLRVKF